jgi:hypothetical protein
MNNGTLEDAAKWADLMGEKGVYVPTTAKVRASAIRILKDTIADNEPQDLEWFVENANELANRWARKNGGKPDTASTYAQRAVFAVEEYVRYLRDPKNFKTGAREKSQSETSAKKASNSFTAPVTGQPMRDYPLEGKDMPFRFQMPSGTTKADVQKIAAHLWTLASDFDGAIPGGRPPDSGGNAPSSPSLPDGP